MPMYHPVYSRKLLSVISRVQCHWLSANLRCGLDGFHRVCVTALKGATQGWLLSHNTTIPSAAKPEGREKQLTSQNTQPLFGLWHWESVDSNVFFWSDCSPLPFPIPTWLYFWEGPSQSEEHVDKGWQAGERPGKHHHSSIHTSTRFQAAPRVS